MPSHNKPRLYLALYSHPSNPNILSYALHLTPKATSSAALHQTTKYIIRPVLLASKSSTNIPAMSWTLDSSSIDTATEPRLLARLRLGKILCDRRTIDAVMRHAARPRPGSAAHYDSWGWCRAALELAVANGCLDVVSAQGLRDLGFESLRSVAREFAARKGARVGGGGRCGGSVASLDLMSGEEFVLA